MSHLKSCFTDFDSFKNYEGVEDNPDANDAIQGYVKKGYLSCHDTLEGCRSFLGGSSPVLSKLGCIVKVKENEIGQVIKKTRIILDATTVSCYEGNRKEI